MYENLAKAEFVNYLMHVKHGVNKKKTPILENLTKEIKVPGFFEKYNAEFTEEELGSWLTDLEKFIKDSEMEEKAKDLVFGFLYGCQAFTKGVKKKTFGFEATATFYKECFENNKKYMCEYNKKDKGKVNINAPKNVVCRFPPEASGLLHIGHVKAALLNAFMAKDGELILRFDDTNPVKEEKHFEKAIIEDLKLLKIDKYRMVRTSDHFDKLYELAIELIKLNLAYCDNTVQEIMRQERMDGIASKCRNSTVEENLKIFKGMNEGNYQEYCLRAKIDYTATNKALRDPVIYRYVGQPHVETGDKYKIYPTYDFACPVVDSLDGVTLALRTNEYRDRNDQYAWFLEKLNLRQVKIHDFSRMNFENTVLSKRKIKFYVEKGLVTGWDDPRVATLRGKKRLGLNMDVLCEYILSQGSSQKSSTISWDKIWAQNKKAINKMAPRYMGVQKKDAVECEINIEKEELFQKAERVLKMSKNADLGYKTLHKSKKVFLTQEDAAILEEGEELTLMSWGNMIVKEIVKQDNIVKKIVMDEHLKGDFKTTKNKLTWVSQENCTNIKVFEYGNLQNDKDTEDLEEKFNTESKHVEEWIVEEELSLIKPEEYVQIVRHGFYICDQPGEFILIPFTKQKRT